MKVLIHGSLIIAVSFAVHYAIWKIRIPERQIKGILSIFFGVLGICMLFQVMLLHYFDATRVAEILLTDLPERLHVILFVTALTLAYMITYTAIEADSPSLVMITRISGMGSLGFDKNDFDVSMNDELLVLPRINDLVLDKMAVIEQDRYRLTRKGRLFAKIFIYYRRLLKAGIGG